MLKKSFIIILCFLFLFLLSLELSLSQELALETKDFQDFSELSLDDLLNTEVKVASKKATNIRESPGIITLITDTDIANSGARDLIDVLRLVPGFNFGMDIWGVVGASMRGIWGHEGKILLLLDGQEINETIYAGLAFGNHFSVEQIERIEIIRGPGSAIYGGYAELAVVNIITKSAKDINGIHFSGIYGQMKNTFGRRNVNISFGKEIKGLSLTSSLFIGQGTRSDRDFTDFYGNTYNMKDNSELNPTNVNIGIGYKGLAFRFILDHYHTTERDVYYMNLPDDEEAMPTNFDSYFFEGKYDFKLGKNITITPKLNYKRQIPWWSANEDVIRIQKNDTTKAYVVAFDATAERYSGSIAISYDYTEKINVITGADVFVDKVKDNLKRNMFSFYSKRKNIEYNNIAGYTQGLFNTRYANITLGVRYDKHNQYGSSFVPRFGITRIINKLHFKLLYSKAFRAPSIANIDTNPNIVPEKTTVVEFETGYQFKKNMFISANVFDTQIKGPIIYSVDTTSEYYNNYEKTGTRGFELEYRLECNRLNATTNYSYYRVNENKVELYEVPENKNYMLAFPAHKLTLNSSIKISQKLSVNPSFVYFGDRYGYYTIGYVDTTEIPVMKKFPPILLLNAYILTKDLLVKNLSAGIGVYNILDAEDVFIQPYNSWHAPLPGPSREVILRVSYIVDKI